MILFPAIDLFGHQAVRLYKGRYEEMTVYSPDPVSVAQDFAAQGATHLHLVDLEGARDGGTPHLDTVVSIKQNTPLFCEIGGGIRSLAVLERYLEAGLDRVILGTAALEDPAFLRQALALAGEKLAVGVDIRDGMVAVRGWLEKSQKDALTFAQEMEDLGVSNLICTDISRDGALKGANHDLYRTLTQRLAVKLTASGGVSALEDVKRLRDLGLYGAIAGKAIYTGALRLPEALEAAR